MRKAKKSMFSKTNLKAWHWFSKNKTLQAFNDKQEDSFFEDFCLDLMTEIAVDELKADITDMDEFEADEYVADWFNFDVINPDELINEFKKEEQK